MCVITTDFQRIFVFRMLNYKVIGRFSNDSYIKHNKFATLHYINIKKKNVSIPWITENINWMFKLKENALSRFKRTKKGSHWMYYKELRNFTKWAVSHEKKLSGLQIKNNRYTSLNYFI